MKYEGAEEGNERWDDVWGGAVRLAMSNERTAFANRHALFDSYVLTRSLFDFIFAVMERAK